LQKGGGVRQHFFGFPSEHARIFILPPQTNAAGPERRALEFGRFESAGPGKRGRDVIIPDLGLAYSQDFLLVTMVDLNALPIT